MGGGEGQSYIALFICILLTIKRAERLLYREGLSQHCPERARFGVLSVSLLKLEKEL